MRNKQAIIQEISDLHVLREMTEAYAEIASIRMKESRERVLKNRAFLEVTEDIFREVRISYARQLQKLLSRQRRKAGGKVTLLAHNGRNVCVLLSANSGLYGDIVQRSFELMLQEVRKSDPEVTIIGKLGLSLYQQAEPGRPYTYFDLPDTNVVAEDLVDIIKHIVRYEQIHLYYGQFQSVITQIPTMYNISSELPLDQIAAEAGNEQIEYIFEPSLEQVLMFFESEIFASLFDQSVRESQLSKYASRMFAMDSASQNVQEYIKKVDLEKLRFTHSVQNKKQLNTLSSFIQ